MIKKRYPFQVVLIQHSKSGGVFEEAVERAFKGALSAGGYLASGEDLGVEFRKFEEIPINLGNANNFLNSVYHSFIVAIVDQRMSDDQVFINWLKDCFKAVKKSKNKHALLVLCLSQGVHEKLLKKLPSINANFLVCADDLGEKAIQPPMFSFKVLHEARVLLARDLKHKGKPGRLVLFISHAKLDGLPLAQSLKHQIKEIKWLKSFYDVRDLRKKDEWPQAVKSLKKAASNSVLIVLRTDAYENRYWCRQEVLWAEENASPAILVEARPGLSYPGGELPLERMPSVRIPDGNLFRILNVALRESLRQLLFQRRILALQNEGHFEKKSTFHCFSYPPSMAALLFVCQKFLKSGRSLKKCLILYPDPPLRTGLYEAAMALISAKAPGVRLLTPDAVAAELDLPK